MNKEEFALHQAISDYFDIPVGAVNLAQLDFIKVMKHGADKYGWGNWLKPDGTKSSEKDMHASMARHWGQSSTDGWLAEDKDSGLDPLLHLQCRASMLYTRRQNGILHPEDEPHLIDEVDELAEIAKRVRTYEDRDDD